MEILIVMGAAIVAAVAIKLYKAWAARQNQAPAHVHDALMKQAQAYVAQSPFLKKVCREYAANGHISDRQAEAVAKALARLGRREA
ncbi:MAG: hypothetical protein EBY18_14365 [Alphaproteobacteria bacterium]|nr:hypothetical protein [Alphaproteobacteria bacterium]